MKAWMRKAIAVVALVSVLLFSPMAFPIVRPAESAVPIWRIDNFLEDLIQVCDLIFHNWVVEIATNIANIKSLMNLVKIPDIINQLSEIFDLKLEIIEEARALIEDKVGSVLKELAGGELAQFIMDGEELINMISRGDFANAGNIVVDKVKEKMIELAGEGGEGAGNVAEKSVRFVAETTPMSFPGSLKETALAGISSTRDALDREVYAWSVADASKKHTLEKIAEIVAPYVVEEESDASYAKIYERIREDSKKVAEDAQQFSSGGSSEALRAIAGLSAAMVTQMSLQNEALVSLATMLADDIRLSATQALVNTENYTEGVVSGVKNWMEIWERSAERISR